jgi:CRP-like cAMP-binding protein
MASKYTKRDSFAVLRGIVTGLPQETVEECVVANRLIAFIDHEIELLDRKSKSPSVNAKHAAEQAEAMDCVRLSMSDEPMRATAIAEAAGYSVQKVSALLRKMVASGEVVREQDKKVVTFRLP